MSPFGVLPVSRLDDAPSRAAVESANANVQMMTAALDKAQLEYNGKKNLRQKSVVSDFELSLAESDLNVAKANLAAAKAALTSAHNDLRYTEIRSPSNGVVGRIFYRKGDLVGPSIQDGLTVVDERTGAVSVCAVATDIPDGMLLSGGTGKIVIPTELHNAIVIPQEATYSIQDKVYVMKEVDGKAVASIIQVEPQNNGKEYMVISGLQEGDVIIAKGAGFVEEGTVIVKP